MKLSWFYLNKAFHSVWETSLDILFPIECLGCSVPGAYFCDTCRQHCLDTNIERHCPICLSRSPIGATHGKCLSPQAINGIFAAGNYHDYVMRDAIKKIKYRNVMNLAPELALFIYEQMQIHFQDMLREIDFKITYIPLHRKRQKQRGYNQSELIACEFGKLTGMTVTSVLDRIRETEDQTKLNRLERFLNVDKAFVLKTNIKNENFLVIDDVFTTGATMMEASKVLKRNGAGIVWGVTIAKESDSEGSTKTKFLIE